MNKIAIDQIRVESRARQDVGGLYSLCESMQELGLLQPIVLTPDLILIAGERELEAEKALGWSEIDATILQIPATKTNRLRAELIENEERLPLTNVERMRLGMLIEQVEREAAKERQNSGLPLPPKMSGTPRRERESATIAAHRAGMAPESFRLGKSVVRQIDQLLNQGEDDKALKLENMANRSISGAARHIGILKPEPEKRKNHFDYKLELARALRTVAIIIKKCPFDIEPQEVADHEIAEVIADFAQWISGRRRRPKLSIVADGPDSTDEEKLSAT